MISKNQIKTIRSLESKKGRLKEGLFVAEGPKVVGDLLAAKQAHSVFATQDWIDSNGHDTGKSVYTVTAEELRKVSFLQHPQQVLALFPLPKENPTRNSIDGKALYIALDGVQDPGNLGTIIRIADWFGITRVFCSKDTADVYNPKVIQATMGSVARVEAVYVDLPEMIRRLPADYPVYGTFLDGEDIYTKPLTPHGIIVMGNEGKGISKTVSELVNRRLLIPNFPKDRTTADSLNVAIATAITCSEFRRKLS